MTDFLDTESYDVVEGPIGDQSVQMKTKAVLRTSRWLAGSTVRRNRLRMIVIVLTQVFGAAGTALGTLAVIFYIRAAIGDGTLGRLNIQIEGADEPGRAALFLTALLALICVSAFALWFGEKQINQLALSHAKRLRAMITKLLDDPLSSGWSAALGHERPASYTQQVIVTRIRSSMIAMGEVLAVGPSIVLLLVSLTVMVAIDPFATLIALPVSALFGVIAERVNRDIQELTSNYESRQATSRDLVVDQIDDLAEGYIGADDVSYSRSDMDDQLFFDRQLVSRKLQLLSIVNGAFVFALVVAYFIIVRGVETLSIELVIGYIFAIRFAVRSVQQLFRALVQVSRRSSDIAAVQGLISVVDSHRAMNALRRATPEVLDEFKICLGHREFTINKRQPVLIVSSNSPDEQHARAVLRVIESFVENVDLDLAQSARVVTTTDDDVQVPDMLATEHVRVIISDNPTMLLDEDRYAFTFVLHNRPKLALAAVVQRRADEFGTVLVVRDGQIVWAGSLYEAQADDAHIRSLVSRKKRREGRPAPTAPVAPTQS